MIRHQAIMFLWFLFLSHVLGAPSEEFEEYTKIIDDDIISDEQQPINYVPGFGSDLIKKTDDWQISYVPELAGIDMSNEYVKNFNKWIEKGTTKKGLTFTVYNDDMRESAVALFRLFTWVKGENFSKLKLWAEQNINREMCLYALRLSSLYGSNIPENDILPPFITNPRYFVNSEAIIKTYQILDNMRHRGEIDPEEAEINQFDYVHSSNIYTRQFITVNSNYSGWNQPRNGIDEEINYFREDIGLNSYYLGLHLLHPFWMSNNELDETFPRHAEHYYYAHQQLMARYLLEKEHLPNKPLINHQDVSSYVPYLTYENGLPFPTRTNVKGNWDNEQALIKAIDIAIKECIDRRLIIMENGTTINMTDDSHIEVLARLIHANLDGVRTAKVVRSVFGYGSNRFPVNEYSPAPSLLHHPETSLRDPAYWYLIQYALNYFTDFKYAMEPYDLTQYETENIRLIDEDINMNMTTYFHSYKFILDYARKYKLNEVEDHHTFISVRQKRLKHEPFEIKLVIEASARTMSVVRVFVGPQCANSCWLEYAKFFELDTYLVELQEGYTPITLSSKSSRKHSFDSLYDTIVLKNSLARKSNAYSIYKFPDSLLIPRGLENGLNLTLFVMVTPAEKNWVQASNNFSYRRAVKLFDTKPLGFPFHRQAAGFKDKASNYRFYNLTIYHKRQPDETSKTFFSPHLY